MHPNQSASEGGTGGIIKLPKTCTLEANVVDLCISTVKDTDTD